MASASNPGNYVDFDEYVGLKLEKTRSKIRSYDVLTALFGVAAMVLAYLFVFVVLDQWAVRDGFSIFWRWILFSTLMISTITWSVWKIGIPSFRAVNGLFAAREIEKAEPGLKSNLLNLVDLQSGDRKVNPFILRSIERQAAVQLQKIDVSQAIDHRPLVRTLYILLAIIVVCCVYALLTPKKVMNSIWRGILPASQIPLATATEIIRVKPEDTTIPAHQPSVEIEVELGGEIPQQVRLFYSSADGQLDHPVEMYPLQDGQPTFRGQIVADGSRGLMQDLTYFVRAGDATSRPYHITVEQPPYADIEELKIEFPAYMKLQPIDQHANGNIDSWEGAKVFLSAKTNMPVRVATIEFLDDPQSVTKGEEVNMTVTAGGRLVQAQWTLALRSDGTYAKYYRIHCHSESGRVTTGHVIYSQTIRPDLPPDVVVLQPDKDLEAPANSVIPLLIQARDPDFELGYLYLNVEKSGQRIVRDMISEGHQSKLILKQDLELPKLAVVPGDEINFWIEAYDNKQPRPNSRNTPKIKIKVIDPLSKKDAERQFDEQNSRRDQKIAEADPDANSDSPQPTSQKEGDRRDPQRSNSRKDNSDPQSAKGRQDQNPQSRERQPEQPAPAQPNPQKQSGKSGEGSRTAKSGQGGEQQNPSKPSEAQNGSRSNPEKPVENDGSQDDEALRRISQKMSERKSRENNSANDSRSKSPDQKPSSPSSPSQKDPSQENSTGAKQKPSSESSNSTSPTKKPDTDATGKPREDKPTPDASSDTAKNTEKNTEKNPPANGADEGATPSQPDRPSQPDGKGQNSKTPAKPQREKGDPKQTDPESKSADQNDDANTAPGRDPSTDSSKQRESSTTKEDQKPASPDATNDNSKSVDRGDQRQSDDASNDKPKSTKANGQDDKESAGESKSDPQDPMQNGSKSKGDKPDSTGEQKDPPANGSQDSSQNAGQSKSKSDADGEQPSKDASSHSDSNKKTGTGNQPDSSDEKPDTKKGNSKSTGKSDSQQPQEQVPSSPDAKKGDADGSEQGTGEPDRDPNSTSKAKRNKQVKSDPNQKPATRPSDSSDEESAEKRKTSDGNSKSTKPKRNSSDEQPTNSSGDDAPRKTNGDERAKPESREKPPQTPSTSGKDSQKNPQDSSQGTGDDSRPSKEGSSSAEGEKGDPSDAGTKQTPSQSSSAEKKGAEKSSDQSRSSDDKNQSKGSKSDSGTKKSSGNANNDSQGDSKSNSKPGTPKSGDPSGEKQKAGDEGKSGQQKSNGKSSSSRGNSSKSGDQAGTDDASQPDGGASGANGASGSGTSLTEGDPANLEYNQQATEMVLQKLKRDLERGEVDSDMLKEMGWTEADLKKFADRVSKSLNESKLPADTPESRARQQQFQEMLKNLDLKHPGTQRSGAKEPKRDVDQVESKQTPPPAKFKSAYEKLTKDLARQNPPPAKKPEK